MGLALLAAVSHAVFGALQKGRHDPWLTRGAIDVCLFVVFALPVALFLVPWPEGRIWLLLGGAMVIHLGYKLGAGDGLQPRRLHRGLSGRARHRAAR